MSKKVYIALLDANQSMEITGFRQARCFVIKVILGFNTIIIKFQFSNFL